MTHPHAMFDDVLKRVDLSSRARENIARGQNTAENSLSLVFSAGAPLWTAYNRYLNIALTIDYRDYVYGIRNALISPDTPPNTGLNTLVYGGAEY